MPKVTIDNQTVEVPNGTLVVETAKKVGIEIPVFCYHPKLQPVGMCRMCLVEVGTPKRGNERQRGYRLDAQTADGLHDGHL